MFKKSALRVFLAIVLLFILYEIWPLPFWYVSRYVLLPSAEKVSQGYNIVVSPFRFLGQMGKLDQENKRLTQENQGLTAQIASLNENVHLCTLVGSEASLSKTGVFQTVVGRIVGRTPESFNQDIVVNIGLQDGVKNGAAVLSSGYLIGQVKKTDSNQSIVHLISSHDSLVPAILEKSRQTGLIQGGLEGLTLTEIPATAQVESGDRVLTSGLGGDLPSGILVGTTENASKDKDNLFQSVKLVSPIQPSALEVVSIVK